MADLIIANLTKLIESDGLSAVFILMAAESALIPIPSEITMTFAGFLAGRGLVNFWLAVFIGALGNLVGSLLTYLLGAFKGEEWVRAAIRKWGKWLLIKESKFNKAKIWFHRHGQGVVFRSRLLPIVRAFISLPAGTTRMNLPLFSVLIFSGSFVWCAFLAWIGLELGQYWFTIAPYFKKFQVLFVGLGVAAVGIYIRSHFRRRK